MEEKRIMDVITTEYEITSNIMAEYATHLTEIFRAIKPIIETRIKEKIAELIWASPETESLISGDLKKHLGIIDAKGTIQEIINMIQNSMELLVEPINYSGTHFSTGGFIIKVLKSDFQDILSTSNSSYITRTGNTNIPWLSWLLFAGNSPLIYGYRIEFNPHNIENSRTGAIMVKNPGGIWSIPDEHAGTQENNFLTRALTSLENEIDIIIKDEISKRG
jgi:hypothetical protein